MRFLPVLCGIVAAVIWGTQPTISKLGYLDGLSAWDLTFLRYLLSGLLMLPFVLGRGIGDACGVGWRRTLALMLVAGPLYSLVLTGGLKWAPAAHGALIYPALTPVFGALLARFVFKQTERISVLGLLLLVTGIVFIGLENILRATAGNGDAWKGDLLFVLAAFMWALYIGLMRVWKTPPVAAMALIQVGGLAYLPAYLWFNGTTVLHAPIKTILLQSAFHGVMVSIVSVTLLNLAVQKLGIKASMFAAVAPLIGVALAAHVLGEALSVWVVTGMVAIVAGLVLTLRSRPAPIRGGQGGREPRGGDAAVRAVN